jgi:hypothetical protein
MGKIDDLLASVASGQFQGCSPETLAELTPDELQLLEAKMQEMIAAARDHANGLKALMDSPELSHAHGLPPEEMGPYLFSVYCETSDVRLRAAALAYLYMLAPQNGLPTILNGERLHGIDEPILHLIEYTKDVALAHALANEVEVMQKELSLKHAANTLSDVLTQPFETFVDGLQAKRKTFASTMSASMAVCRDFIENKSFTEMLQNGPPDDPIARKMLTLAMVEMGFLKANEDGTVS